MILEGNRDSFWYSHHPDSATSVAIYDTGGHHSLRCTDCQMTSSNVLLIEFAIAVSQSPTASSSLSDRNAPLMSSSSVAASTIPGDVPVSDPSQDPSVGSTDGFVGRLCREASNLLREFCFLYRPIQRSSVCRMDITDDRNLILRVGITSSGESY